MNSLREFLAEAPSAREQPRATPIREQVRRRADSPTASVHDDQIHALIQQLFFRHESRPVRHVGFATVEASTATATLCFEIAAALAKEGRYDVGLIDAHPDSVLLQTELQIPSHNRAEAAWPIAPRRALGGPATAWCWC